MCSSTLCIYEWKFSGGCPDIFSHVLYHSGHYCIDYQICLGLCICICLFCICLFCWNPLPQEIRLPLIIKEDLDSLVNPIIENTKVLI